MNRDAQVWLARRSMHDDFEPCVIVGVGRDGWRLRPLGRLTDDSQEFMSWEGRFAHVERGGDDAWVKCRLA